MKLAPIIVFAYNRPNHLKRTLDALSQNELADESTLYIYCDGPKLDASAEQISRINAVREEAKSIKGFKDIHMLCADKNKGLANSIIGGVSEVIEQWGKVIVVEDDLVTEPKYLSFMNAALEHYESFPAVFSVTGDRPQINKMTIPEDYDYDVFVSLRSWSYGWGTWKDRWSRVDWSMQNVEEYKKHPYEVEAFMRCGDDIHNMLMMQQNHEIDSWSIRFSFTHFIHHAVTIMPVHSYIRHIGFDGSGTHCGSSSVVEDAYEHSDAIKFLDVIYEDKRIINAFYNVYCRTKRPLWQKIINTIYRKLGKQTPFVIKKAVYGV